MTAVATPLPCRRADLVIVPAGETGRYVVKIPDAGAYFQIGEEEHFLLSQLDGNQSAEVICDLFARRFGEPLDREDLGEFVESAQLQGLLQEEHTNGGAGAADPSVAPGPSASGVLPVTSATRGFAQSRSARAGPRRFSGQSILYWRINLLDPERLFTWLEPKIRFFWTPGFLVLSAVSIGLAAAAVWFNRQEMAGSFLSSLRWEMALLTWLVLFGVTTMHEFAHGLTCKHYGGEVREVGFLMLLLMPCFYCNVSDAWMFREKSKRLWVTFAGAYFELFVWSLGVFAWRLAEPGTVPHDLAFALLSASGLATLFNFNPLIKLDGYYLVSDWLELPNLNERAMEYAKGQLRRALWGAPAPAHETRGRLLLSFGLVSWLYSIAFLALMLWALVAVLGRNWGWLGALGAGLLGALVARGMLHGFAGGEVRKMITKRHKRTAAWLLILGGLGATLAFVEVDDRAGGSFRLRPAARAELRAPVAGFLREIYCDEGDHISPGAPVARLEVPELESRLVQQQAEVREARSTLRMLEIGPRPEEVAQQRERLAREQTWRDMAEKDLTQARQALQAELARLDKQIAQSEAELAAATDIFNRTKGLRDTGAITEEQYVEAQRNLQVAEAQLSQARFQKQHREILGTREAIAGLDAEAELARREKDLAETRAALKLLEAGSRPEEIEAQRARLARLEEELHRLEALQGKLLVTSALGGLMSTPHLKEKVGQYVREGDLIGLVEDPAVLEAEISLGEQDAGRIELGQKVNLKARAVPLETFAAAVERIAPAAVREEGKSPASVESRITVYCRLANPPADLRPGMSGYARIYTGRRSLGRIMLDRVRRYVRTEFWW